MNFREATDIICQKISHEDIANELGVSLQAIRQSRLPESSPAHRPPPKDWPFAVIRLAEKQIMNSRKLIEEVRREVKVHHDGD